MQNSIVRHLRIFAATLDKLGKYFVVFNFRDTGLTAKYRENSFFFLRYSFCSLCSIALSRCGINSTIMTELQNGLEISKSKMV